MKKEGQSSEGGTPKYSILYYCKELGDEAPSVDRYLMEGIKVIWFGRTDDCEVLEGKYADFIDKHILECYSVERAAEPDCIVDGVTKGKDATYAAISGAGSSFNLDQYMVEHSRNKIVAVTASAGTGKTFVMVERVLFLIHYYDVKPSRIAMITFTRDATGQMMDRLQEAIMDRYALTGSQKYIRLLEQMSSIKISTIDSFSYRLLKEHGVSLGYNESVSITSNTLELARSIERSLDDEYSAGESVGSCLGGNLYDMTHLIRGYYDVFSGKGIPGDVASELNWGDNDDEQPERIQSVIRNTLERIDADMRERRFRNNTVDLSEVIHDTIRAIQQIASTSGDAGFDYLLVDEFQDTNDVQIRLILELIQRLGVSVFIVGDSKQSIYRFRGADDFAFDSFMNKLTKEEKGDMGVYQLTNNYRTERSVLGKMDAIFRGWIARGLLTDFRPLVAYKEDTRGEYCVKRIKADDRLKTVVRDVAIGLRDLKERIQAKIVEDGRVTVLVRSNRQVEEIARECDKNGVPMEAVRDRPLYVSDAVRDLYSMISSYVHPGDSVSMFGYLESPYSDLRERMDIEELTSNNGSRALVQDYIDGFISETGWGRYADRFRFEPALSVIRDMLDDIPVVENYVANQKRKGIVNKEKLNRDAERYQANLNRIMAILFDRFAGDGLDLLHIYNFLTVSMATNREEKEADIEEPSSDIAYCMTIHKAKGLEFDTVILPYDKRINKGDARTEVIVSKENGDVGWAFEKENPDGNKELITNENYKRMAEEEYRRQICEETRILYVAMTRAVTHLVVYTVWHPVNQYSWSGLIEGDMQ